MATALSPPSQTDDSGTFCTAIYNVHSSQNGGLEDTLRAMDSLGIDLGVLQEMKLTGGIYTHHLRGYSVLATDVHST